MAHFIKLDENNVVIDAIVVNNNDLLDSDGKESESIGQEMCRNLHERGGGSDARWIQTSYNGKFRFRYAGLGMVYNEEHDVFLYSQPYSSWILNTETYIWEAPVEQPSETPDGRTGSYQWDEENLSWNFVDDPIDVSVSETSEELSTE